MLLDDCSGAGERELTITNHRGTEARSYLAFCLTSASSDKFSLPGTTTMRPFANACGLGRDATIHEIDELWAFAVH